MTNEAETGRVQAWLAEQAADGIAISDWMTTIKPRAGQIKAAYRTDSWHLASSTDSTDLRLCGNVTSGGID